MGPNAGSGARALNQQNMTASLSVGDFPFWNTMVSARVWAGCEFPSVGIGAVDSQKLGGIKKHIGRIFFNFPEMMCAARKCQGGISSFSQIHLYHAQKAQ
uniref:Uncharacterized protein n=1 Tax=Eutreptiella gymnastica TaxID=73025 RepID=A0A7S1I2D5_9EUGL